MPYKIIWEARGVIWTFSGVLTGEDAVQANLAILGDYRFDDLCYQIVDLSEVKQFTVASEDLDATAALDDAATVTNRRIVVAVVAATSEAVGVAELYKSAMSASVWTVRIFRTMEEAREWIRLSCGQVSGE